MIADLISTYRHMPIEAMLAEARAAATFATSPSHVLPHAIFGRASPGAIDLVFCGPFGSKIGPQQSLGLIRAHLLYLAVKKVDPQIGRLIVFGSPAHTRAFSALPRSTRAQVARGNFVSVAKLHLDCLHSLKVETARFWGFSQGASFAATIARLAATTKEIQVRTVALGDPPGMEDRSPNDMLRRFVMEYRTTRHDAARNSIVSYRDAHDRLAIVGRARRVASDLADNHLLLRGHSRGTLGLSIRSLLDHDIGVTIAVGSRSKVSSVQAISELKREYRDDSNLRIRVLENRGHGWIHDLAAALEFYLSDLPRPRSTEPR